jgi:hypothetical protein
MRSFFLFMLLLPAFAAKAQINRSAKEFAGERIQEYIVNKLFKNQQYKAVSYGELKKYVQKNSGVAWIIAHEFEITEKKPFTGSITPEPNIRQFYFYLNDKMKVIRAEACYSD